MPIPKKVLSRKDEITKDFLRLMDSYIPELMQQKIARRYHTQDFAKQLFIHPVHLTNTLLLTTGKSPCHFLEERLYSEARILLKETGLSVAEVGYKFAFNDPTNFTKFFKSMAGVTPLQYRKSLKLSAAAV